jgi:hypothetical protein
MSLRFQVQAIARWPSPRGKPNAGRGLEVNYVSPAAKLNGGRRALEAVVRDALKRSPTTSPTTSPTVSTGTRKITVLTVQLFLRARGIGRARWPVASGEECGSRARAVSSFLPR